MLSVIIPALNAERTLPRTLSALLPGMIDGVVREVILVDGGSTDDTITIAEAAGVDIVRSERGRGQQLIIGADRARHSWMLFLHADTALGDNWYEDARRFIQSANTIDPKPRAAAFKFALDDVGVRPRLLEYAVWLRCAVLRLPYGDQGLLISKEHYRRIGGYRELPLMEDVDLIRRLKAGELAFLESQALTSATRYQRDGYARRSFRNLSCLAMYYANVPLAVIERRYQAPLSRL
jgi:rSAM/selenodomain-associated transferase 2